MPRIHRERREDREDVGVEVGVEPGPLVRRYVPEPRMEHHPVIGQLRQHLIVKTATVLADQLPDRGSTASWSTRWWNSSQESSRLM